MLAKAKTRFSSRLPITGVILLVATSILFLASCTHAPALEEGQVEETVINRSDIDESNQGVTIHSQEELRRTGKPDAATALKKRDPRIN